MQDFFYLHWSVFYSIVDHCCFYLKYFLRPSNTFKGSISLYLFHLWHYQWLGLKHYLKKKRSTQTELSWLLVVFIEKPSHSEHSVCVLSVLILLGVIVHLPTMQPPSSFGAASEGAHWLRRWWPDSAVSVPLPPHTAYVFPHSDQSVTPSL